MITKKRAGFINLNDQWRQHIQLALLLLGFVCAFTWDRSAELWLAGGTLLALIAAVAVSNEKKLLPLPGNIYGAWALSALGMLAAMCWIRAITSDAPENSILLASFYMLPLVAVLICLQHDRAVLLRTILIFSLIFFPLILLGSAAHLAIIRDFGYSRIKWPFDDANHLAMLFNIGNAIGLATIIHGAHKRTGAALLTTCVTGLLLSGSRAGFLCAALMITTLLLSTQPYQILKPRILLLSSGVIAAIIALLIALGFGASLPFRFIALIVTNPQAASGSRFDFWADTLHLILNRPLFGYGTGTFQYVFPSVIEPDHLTSALAAHNDFLQIWLETGIVGALSYVTLALVVIIGTIRTLPRLTDPKERAILMGSTGAMLVLGVQAQIEFMLSVLPLLIAFGITLAVWIKSLPATATTNTDTKIRERAGQATGAILISLMFLSCALIRSDILIREADNALAHRNVKLFARKLDNARAWSFDLHPFPYIRAANYHLALLLSGNPGDVTSAADIRGMIASARARNPYLSSTYETEGKLDEYTGKSPIPAWTAGLRIEPRNAGLRIALIRYYERMGMGQELAALVKDSKQWPFMKGPKYDLQALLEKHKGVLTCDGVCP